MTPDALGRLGRWLRPSRRRPPPAATPTLDPTGGPTVEPVVTGEDTAQDPDQVRAYWTPERTDAARPREQRRDP